MNVIQLSKIVIKENRQRQEFEPEALQELKCSIEDRGLLHPPVLRRESGTLVLVAGERRLKAISEIFELGGSFWYNDRLFGADRGEIPYSDLGELSHLEAEEAELDENLKRRDLTWQEHAQAVARLHELRKAQKDEHNECIAGGLDTDSNVIPTLPAHTIADTAEELTGRRDGSYQDSVRTEILVAKHLDNPLIANAKSPKEALKILKAEETRAKNIELAKTVGASFNAQSHSVLNMNCLDFMRDPANHNRFDVILTDPPYGMGADSFGDAGGKMTGINHHYDDSFTSWQLLMDQWSQLSFKVANPQAHAYVFCDIDNFHALKSMMEKAGWYVFRTPFIVVKLNSGRVPLPQSGPRRQWECLLYAIKGNKPVTHIYPDVVTVSGDDNLGHGAQKPIALYQNLLQRSVRPGDEVLDSFAGTGTIIPACHTYKCRATAIEMDSGSYGICLKRAQDLDANDQLGLDLGA